MLRVSEIATLWCIRNTYIPSINFNTTNDRPRLPIVEDHETHPLDSQQRSSVNSISGVRDVDETSSFLEVSVDFHFGSCFSNGIGVRVGRPSKADTRSEGLVSPRERGVNDVFSISTDRDESDIAHEGQLMKGLQESVSVYLPTVRTMLQCLSVNFRITQLSRGDR